MAAGRRLQQHGHRCDAHRHLLIEARALAAAGGLFFPGLCMKRMKHPDHGFHHAYNKLEEETMRKAGWVDDEPGPAEPVEVVPEPVEVPLDRATLIASTEAAGGQFHRRWSTERIAKELAKA